MTFPSNFHGRARRAHASEPRFPSALTPALRRVLGMMLWETRPIAGALRAAGFTIGARVEDEQAAALHWLTGFVLEHGDGWERYAAAALRQLTDHRGK